MKKLKLSIKLILLLNIALTIALGIWIISAGIAASQEAAQSAASQGAENGSIVGGAVAGGVVGLLGIAVTIVFGAILFLYAFNTLIAFIIYCLKERHGVVGGILVFLLACPVAGILIIIEGCKS